MATAINRGGASTGPATGAATSKSSYPARIEILVNRDPDGGTDTNVYVDGESVGYDEYVIDPGWGYDWEDWVYSRSGDIASASPAVAAELRIQVLDASESQFITSSPDSAEQRARELDALVEAHRTENRP